MDSRLLVIALELACDGLLGTKDVTCLLAPYTVSLLGLVGLSSRPPAGHPRFVLMILTLL